MFMGESMSGFGITFTIIQTLVIAVFIFAFGSVIWNGIKVARDKQKPIIPVNAQVISKRTRVSGGGEHRARTHYYATFEMENGERIEFKIPDHQIGYIVEGDVGVLSFQGALFVKFERE